MTDVADDRAALLRGVLEHPEDDNPRLVLADYLGDQPAWVACGRCGGAGRRYATVNPGCDNEYDVDDGPCRHCTDGRVPSADAARAEFIRVQCELERLEREGCCCTYSHHNRSSTCGRCRQIDALRRRERELLCGPAFDWFRLDGLATFADRVGGPFGGWILKNSGQPGLEIKATVSRGFVSNVAADLATLFGGGECPTCRGRGYNRRTDIPGVYNDEPGHTLPCPACRGTGTTEGVAKELFAAQPVTAVTLTDREPDHLAYMTPTSFGWWQEQPAVRFTADANRDALPEALWEFFEWDQFKCAEFPTRDAALQALSDACVALGRKLAGLTPLAEG